MKKLLFFIIPVLLTSCQDKVYDRIKNYIDAIKIIDTHEHQQTPADSTRCYFFNEITYFPQDIISSGAQPFNDLPKDKRNIDSIWSLYGKYYNYSRATSYHEQFMNSLRILYDYKKPYVTKDDAKELYNRIINNHYKNYPKWFDEVFHKANFETMILDQYWNQFNTQIDTRYFRLVCRIDNIVMLVDEAAANKKITSDKGLLKLMNKEVLNVKNLDDYVNLVDSVLNIFKRSGAVCIKNALAYHRSLDFDTVDYAQAKGIFNKTAALSNLEKKKLQDFIFHHIVQQSVKLDLPIQIHTGYLAGNNGMLERTHPMKLLNLFMRYPKAKFVLFHGGYPWTGDYIALGKEFTNVYLDIVWLPQISKTTAIRALHEILDAVPYNKLFWGGDVITIDDAVGSLELGKEVVATVLAERVEKGCITEEMAMEISRRIFRENANEFFKLNLK